MAAKFILPHFNRFQAPLPCQTKLLRSNTSIKEVHLRGSGIGDNGVYAIVMAVIANRNSSLKLLDLSYNRITKDGELLLNLIKIPVNLEGNPLTQQNTGPKDEDESAITEEDKSDGESEEDEDKSAEESEENESTALQITQAEENNNQKTTVHNVPNEQPTNSNFNLNHAIQDTTLASTTDPDQSSLLGGSGFPPEGL